MLDEAGATVPPPWTLEIGNTTSQVWLVMMMMIMMKMMMMTMMIYFKERGVYLMNSGRTRAAIASFSQALRTNDQDLRCWILRSNCYIRSIFHGSLHRHFI